MQKYFAFLCYFCTLFIWGQQEKMDQIDHFDFENIAATIEILPLKGLVNGQVQFVFDVLRPQDTLFINGRKMKFSEVMLNGVPAKFTFNDHGIYIIGDFHPSKNNSIQLTYSVQPDSGMYFINWNMEKLDNSQKQVWTQGQGKYTSTWLPSFDDMREKLEFDLSFKFPAEFELISVGKLVDSEKINDTVKLWKFDMEKPISSYLVAIAAGKFNVRQTESESGDLINLYYKPEDSLKNEPTYRYSKEIFDFLEEEIGVEYPWQHYNQVPVHDFLYGGMENTGTTIFSSSLVTDSIGFKDRNYVNVNAHELAHQWFGDLVTETTSTHHWLHEGFASFYALLAEKKIFGEEYYYWKLYEIAEKLKERSDSGKGEAVLNAKASAMTFYEKGAWALHILREQIGEDSFRQGVKNYLDLYAFKNVETDNFLAEMESASGQDLTQFRKDWLEQSAFKATQSLESLKKSAFITGYLNIAALRETPLNLKYEILDKALNFPVNEYIGQEVILQISTEPIEATKNLYKKAFNSNNVFVRQSIALNMKNIPDDLKSEYESLLKDESYLTVEVALYKLWDQFPEDRAKYLEQTRDIIGFYNKNIRMLWLTLNLVTPDFETDQNQNYFEELAGYTDTWRPFQVRENAFGYLFQLGAFTPSSLESLIKGTQHHTYSFRNYCRQLFLELLKNEEYKKELIKLSESMTEGDTNYIRSKITG